MMSERSIIHTHVVQIFEAMHLDEPPDDADLFETGFIDSMAFVQLLLHLEERLGVSVSLDDMEIENFRSIHNIVDFVSNFRRRGQRIAG